MVEKTEKRGRPVTVVKPEKIVEWLSNCVNECEVDGYQQQCDVEDVNPEWPDGFPEIVAIDGATVFFKAGKNFFTAKFRMIPRYQEKLFSRVLGNLPKSN